MNTPTIDTGGPAFGMTMLDWFAGQALTGLLANRTLDIKGPDGLNQWQALLCECYQIAVEAVAEKRCREGGGQ